MNDWNYHPVAIVESDDFQDKANRSGIEYLFYWKSRYPKFKITLFTIPDLTSLEYLNLVGFPNDWVELAVHGYSHQSNFECFNWDESGTHILMERVEKTGKYIKGFKAPGWQLTGNEQGVGSGYPLTPPSLLAKDNQAIYKALGDRGYWIMDRHYNASLRPKDANVICIDDNPLIVHLHTWPMETGDMNGRNGFDEVEEFHGVPWDNQTEFFFMSEAIEKGMITPCQK